MTYLLSVKLLTIKSIKIKALNIMFFKEHSVKFEISK
jgi:hypothetical protein